MHGRTRGVIPPHVLGLELFDLFVRIKGLMDPRHILHPGVKIVEEARNKKLDQAIEEMRDGVTQAGDTVDVCLPQNR